MSEVIDFARFLEFQHANIREQPTSTFVRESLTDGDKQWEALLASDEAQQLLQTLADEASNKILAGKPL